MKKLFLILGLMIMAGIITGCSKNAIPIGDMAGDFTNIEVTNGATGAIMTLDIEQTDRLYEKFKNLEFVQGKSARNQTDWEYQMRFLMGSKETARFGILSTKEIIYNGYYYEANESGIDLNALLEIFYEIFYAEIISTGETLLIAPDPDSWVFASADRIVASVTNANIYDQKDNLIAAEDLEAGDIIRIAFNGIIAESYPAQLTASRIDRIDHDILIDGYLSLINDVYIEDSGLNGDITMIAFDTSEWIELSDLQKEIILTQVSQRYGLEVIQGTYKELVEEGLIDGENLYFEQGVLITLNEMSYNPDKKVLEASIEKWRSGLGAIGWDGKAVLKNGEWKISRGAQWIS